MSYIEKICFANWRFRSFFQYKAVSASVETHYRYIIDCDTRPGQLTFHEGTADIMISQCICRDPL